VNAFPWLQIYSLFQDDVEVKIEGRKSEGKVENMHEASLKQEFKELLILPRVE